MEKLIKTRSASRGWVTREATQLAKLMNGGNTPPTCESLKLQIAEFDKRLAALDEIQTKIEQQIDNDTELEDNIGEAYDFRSKILLTKFEALEKLTELTKTVANTNNTSPNNVNNSSSSSNTDTSTSSLARLPKLEISKFNGDITLWQSFWDQFGAIVDNSNIPKINKFTYLKSLLEGDALETIRGLPLTEDNYDIAKKCLEERYGRRERIIFAHIQALLSLSIPQSLLSVATLWKLRDKLNTHVRCLDSMGINGKQYGAILTPLILSKLPEDLRMEWARTGEGKESDLEWLLAFLKTEIERRERSDSVKEALPRKAEEKHYAKKSVTAAMQTTSTTKAHERAQCLFCGKTSHDAGKCWKAQKLSVDDCYAKLKETGVCFRCLSKDHFARECVAKCSKCNGSHHLLICKSVNNDKSKGSGNAKVNHVGVSCINTQDKVIHTVLQTANVLIKGTKGNTYANILFDTGSDNTYVTSSLVKRVKPNWITSKSLSYAAFGGAKPSPSENHNIYNLSLVNKMGGIEPIRAVEVKTICAPRYRSGIDRRLLESISHLNLADHYDNDREIKIDMLIGLDHYWEFMRQEVIRLPGGLVVQDTVFGWIISGSWEDKSNKQTPSSFNCNVSHQLFCQADIHDTTSSFWDLDIIGVKPELEADPHDKVLTQFNETVKFVNGRYEVQLPWKDGMQSLLNDNRRLAEVRLKGLTRRFVKNPALEMQYNATLEEMERLSIIREVLPCDMTPDRPIYYMPHHPVVKESSLTTKVRPVFDASAKGVNNVSLNDCLESGPALIPNIVEILIRFRRWAVGLTADITKAFLQIGVNEIDQDVHRFLWPQNGSVRVMKFTRVPFGNTSSPFLLNATIKHHLSQYSDSVAVSELRENIYVDDWLSGADDEVAGGKLFREANQIMAEGSFPFSSWNSNNHIVDEMFFHEFGSKHMVKDPVKILGLKWIKSCDSFSFEGIEIPTELVITKRVVLSFLARLFDPLGFLTPFTMYIKILMQDIWMLNLQWDDELPQELQLRFRKWSSGLHLIENWKIPRRFMSCPWTYIEGLELHCFGDASEKGYGSVVYLRRPIGNGNFEVSFVTSRARVAPLKKVSLPRLELLAALLTARLMVFVCKTLKIQNVVYRCWTDSSVALGWIRGQPSRWKTFVANRVSEIQQLTNTSCWSHCPGKGNPADLVTRGALSDELLSSTEWLVGPHWLHSQLTIPVDEVVTDKEIEQFLQPEMKVVLPVTMCEAAQVKVLEVERWSKFSKAIRITGWVLRFINNSRRRRKSGVLSHEELLQAEIKLISHIQNVSYNSEIQALKGNRPISKSSSLLKLNPLVGDDGLLRIGGRLGNSELSFGEKHPAIIPKGHLATLIVRHQHIMLKHAGVQTVITTLRNKFWIIGLRRLVKAIKKACVPCQRVDSQACNQITTDLPKIRVQQAPPFTVTGLDYAGPLFCIDFPKVKFYILLFTCAVVRAIHLELTDSLSKENCVLAIRRFIARRGSPTIFCSDNAKTFQATEKHLIQYCGTEAPKWRYIAPRSPWWGGWWERLVRSVKGALKKSLGSECLTRVELETCLHEVEACINSRPLTFVSDEIDGSEPLTPSHFLIGRTSGFVTKVSEIEVATTHEDIVERELTQQGRVEEFWRRWSQDYLRNLPPSINKFKSKGSVCVGSLVLIREDNLPRMQWPRGRIVKAFPGKDGIPRAFQIKTAKGLVTRSIQRLHHLELVDNEEPTQLTKTKCKVDSDKVEEISVTRRTGRISKPVKRLDL